MPPRIPRHNPTRHAHSPFSCADEVIKASRADSDVDTELGEEEVPPETQTEDFVEDSEPERAKQRPKKKKQQKKPVPVGRNGLKKRRVLRTRTKTDEKGYMGMYPCAEVRQPADSLMLQSRKTTRHTSLWTKRSLRSL